MTLVGRLRHSEATRQRAGQPVANSRRYCIPPQAIRTIAALVILREKVLRLILAGVGKPKMGRKPKNWSPIDEHYEAVRQDMCTLRDDLRTAA